MRTQRCLSRRIQRVSLRCVALEFLEARHLLAADLVPSGIEALSLNPNDFDSQEILVRFADDASPGLSSLAEIVPGSYGTPLLSSLPSLKRVALPATINVEEALAAFRANPSVVYAEPNYRLQANLEPNDLRYDEMWPLENSGQTGGVIDADIDAAGAWDVNTGSGAIVVAVIDTGVNYQHADLADNMWTNPLEIPGDQIDNDNNGYVDDVYGYDFANRDGDPMDDQGHGTHVAGTIGAVGNNQLGVTGINWNVQIMALKFLGADGSGTTADAIEAINYAVANGADLSNNSWGGDPYSQAMFDAISAAADAGHLFVAAAGNGNAFGIGQNNDAIPFYPSGYELDNVIAVAAVDHQDQIASFSNYGTTTVDIAAPGVNILSTTSNGGYGLSSGTSMASPHVAGAAALVWDTHPEWSYTQVIDKLLTSVDPLPGLQGLVSSNGRLNLATALDNPQPGPPPPPPGSLPIVEDFQDNQAQFFDVQSANWQVENGRYRVDSPVSDDSLAGIATLRLDAPLPSDFELRATVNADEGYQEFIGIIISDRLTNGFFVFDYQDSQNFRFAGPDMDQDRWVIGYRDANGWHVDTWQASTLNASQNYDLRLIVQNDTDTQLWADGQLVLTHDFASPVTGGDVGVGGRNSATYFDNFVAREYRPTVPTSFPLVDDFTDASVNYLEENGGISTVDGGQLHVTPFTNADGIASILLDQTLPAEVDMQATFNADDASAGRLSNAFLVFDYQSPTNFKFAGAYVGIDEWLIGRRTANDWVADAIIESPISALTDYQLRLTLEDDGNVTLYTDGVARVSYQYGESLTDGRLGFGTKNAWSRFDNLTVDVFTPPPTTTLPYSETFDDGTADFFDARSGAWVIQSQETEVTPAQDADGIGTLRIESLPTDFRISATINVDPAANGRLSNGFLVFDYQSPTDFKFAGAYAGSDKWLVGHRDASGWVVESSVVSTIDTLTDYQVQLEIVDDLDVTLYVDGAPQFTHTFADSLRDGAVGIGTRDAIARFDNLAVTTIEVNPVTPGSFPLSEDFEDGVADHLAVISGLAGVSNGRFNMTPFADGDGIATVELSAALPDNVTWRGVVNASAASSNRLSNAFLIFDYVNPTNFKFAGSYVGVDKWLIGHRNASDWITDVEVVSTISAETDYTLQVTLDASGIATLAVDGIKQVAFDFGESLTNGKLGVGTKNSLAEFDDLMADVFTPPSTTTLPFTEDFSDGIADYFDVQSGTWSTSAQRYDATPVNGSDAVATIRVDSLPSEFEVEARINAEPAANGQLTNAFLIFDYQSSTDFKFAGAYVGSNQWLIGHRNASGWQTDASFGITIDPQVDYDLKLVAFSTSEVTLYVDGVPRVAHAFADSLSDGLVGIGTRNASSHFDNVAVQERVITTTPPTDLPMFEDFNDGQADHFLVQSGFAGVSNGRYQITPQAGADGVSTVVLSETLPANVQLQATMNADGASTGRLSNGFLIFDYVGPTNFKFAGAYVGTGRWLIGQRDASGWVTQAYVSGNISSLTDYDLRVTLESDGTATLFVNGTERVWHNFGQSLTDGDVGVGTSNAITRFDDFSVSSHAKVALPYLADFNGGTAEYFEERLGVWNVGGSVYDVTPAINGDGISTLRLQPLPTDFEVSTVLNAEPAALGRLSNAFVIFDYHGPEDFNFAGAYMGSDRWLIGHRNSSGWVMDASTTQPIEVFTDYDVRVRITNDTQVTLFVDDVAVTSHTYGDSLRDGDVGVGTRNAIARFDNVLAQSFSTPQVQIIQDPGQLFQLSEELLKQLLPFGHEELGDTTSVTESQPKLHLAHRNLAWTTVAPPVAQRSQHGRRQPQRFVSHQVNVSVRDLAFAAWQDEVDVDGFSDATMTGRRFSSTFLP